ncbi:MAG: hypothetical protein A3C80_02010 [Candidatus Ryanbacteria bacterium RIFCSPHIGHO2_02_FULL_45_43]|uniref:Host attachment protein n=1 Tax=Candidatus Ryanbacteria bacterium RIFCSPHIGHO2_01_45_13 TaxID=1802112 RepID=A0A1G2FY61_9BACT|nr:MAG: hypothetical protein A2718_02840 [Candidatus Ryanbacteria bacterium RIFCSPHIGHO2_01_FULL_44_130]OGZ43015.1 MAG: hypothetical protein A2W41_02785 [Candidatus Ryanbacteria bacterium RIFCSPHIGHO2_01_45_13]OGZ48720.1 MAG: hypothetical protein A3C80_02010 [Candidatus Ryanbacteria bacterium RIFCSPHIGHO2_02_FULL_45_43]OGZ50660.1 MAG: hypothetical protein A3E55_03490 [Candidatus Ryanbacteria bacterium RIFCSPHIGHO2_12_FULL_44_20]OGZ51966.1 MAG: hypothetical protein A3A17_00865 [Candidatus Ryanba
MKIQRQLPQFENEKALFVVAGKQSGVLYYVSNGQIHELETVRVATPHYSDKEGFFATRTRGGVMFSGAVREVKKQEIRKRFSKNLAKSVKRHASNKDFVYLFVSRQMSEEILHALPVAARKRVKKIYFGNLAEFHPFDILRRVKT